MRAHKVSAVSLCHGATVFHCPRAHWSHRPRSLVHRRGEHWVRNAAPYAPGRAPLKAKGTPRGGGGRGFSAPAGREPTPDFSPSAPGPPLPILLRGGREDARQTECFCGEWPAAFSPAGGSTPLGRREESRGGVHIPSVHSNALLSRPQVARLYLAIHLECFFCLPGRTPEFRILAFRA